MHINTLASQDVFARNGIASLTDLIQPEWNDILKLLEEEQASFLHQEAQFRSDEYPWPRDPLHTWSRVWEYPYVYYHLNQWIKAIKTVPLRLKVADIGSGVTFFPFSIARLGYEVVCTDIDPICQADIERAEKVQDVFPGDVSFRLIQEERLPFKDEELDAIYCISVLEHIPNPSTTVAEITRVLKPGGLLILTFDLDMRGDSEIGVEKYQQLIELLDKSSSPLYPERTIHPADMLTSISSPYGFKPLRGIDWFFTILKQYVVKPVLRGSHGHLFPYYLSVEGRCLRRSV